MDLIWPSIEALPCYADALRQGWSPDTMRPETATDQLAEIDRDPVAFLESLVDRQASGPPIPLPDGTFGQRLPGFHKWMWDSAFAARSAFAGSPAPPIYRRHVLGHIGYSVVPWKRRLGYATRRSRCSLPDATAAGLEFVEVTTDLDNIGSQRVIEANGGVLLDGYEPDPVYGVEYKLRYRISVAGN